MNRVLYDSYVKHRNFFPWRKVKKEWVEGLDNRAWGTVKGTRFEVQFTNSYGKSGASLSGTFRSLFGLFIAKGTAYGYDNFPKGRSCIAFGFFKNYKLHLIVPGFDSKYLSIRMSYKELPDD